MIEALGAVGQRLTAVCVGAGIEQAPAISRAQHLGLTVVALDGDESAPGLDLADHRVVVDITDEQAVIDSISEYQVDVVVPAPLGRLMLTVGAINDARGLGGVTREQVRRCVDKESFSETLKLAGLYSPRHVVATASTEIHAALSDIGTAILKPSRGSGSNGIVVVQPHDDVDRLVEEHLARRPVGEVTLVSEFVTGREIGVDVLVRDQEAEIVAVRDKAVTELPYRQELAYILPAVLSDERRTELKACVDALVATLSLETAPIHLDVILADDGRIVVIDCSPRPSGMFISTRLVPYVTGCDVVTNAIRDLIGQDRLYVSPFGEAAVLSMMPTGGIDKVACEACADSCRVEVVAAPTAKIRSGPIRNTSDVLSHGLFLIGSDSVDGALHCLKTLAPEVLKYT